MAKLSTLFAVMLLLVAYDLKGMVNGKLQPVIEKGDRLKVGFSKTFQDGKCQVAMMETGSLVVSKQKKEMRLMWQTGVAPGHVNGDEYVLQIKKTGNMVIKRIIPPDRPKKTVSVYDTHTEGDVGKYFLGIDQACALEIHEGTSDKIGDIVWSNVKWWMDEGDTLGVSEIYSVVSDGCEVNFMFMNPNGNLEIYDGRDFASARDKPPVWESNTKRQIGDYQFRIDENSTLSLLDVATGEQYWKKDLKGTGRPPTMMRRFALASIPCDARNNVGVGPYAQFSNEDNVFMRQGDKIPAGGAYQEINGCGLYVNYDGRLDIDDGLWFKWSSGKAKDDTIGDDYFLMLHDTGNLAMYRGTINNPAGTVWATHTKGNLGNYFLSTDEECYLELFKGTPEEKGELVWSNRVTKLQAGDRLDKAQRFIPPSGGACDGLFMFLRPDNGVLQVHVEECLAGSVYDYARCFEYPEWSFDAGLGEYDDFYMKVTDNGKLRFYGIGKDGDELMGDYFDLGAYDKDFEVALCDESGLALPNAIAV